MGAQEQHDKHVADLMRTRFPIRGDNYKKKGRTLLPRWSKPQEGHDAPYGQAFAGLYGMAPLAQLYVYDEKEDDRPAMVHVSSAEQAREYIRVLSEFLGHLEGAQEVD